MANKNTKQLRTFASKAARQGRSKVEFQKPVSNYHSARACITATLECSRPNGEGVVSASPRRNMQMRVLHNENGNGGKSSLTVHEPIRGDRPVRFKGHGYIFKDERSGYFQPKGITH